jgi:hypothetical protein
MPARAVYDRLLNLGLVVLLLGVGVLSFDRASRGRYDFHHFYRDARHVWERRELNPNLTDPVPERRRQLPFYLPVVALALSPLTAFGWLPAALLWSAAQVAALGYSLTILRRWFAEGAAPPPPVVGFILAILLALPALAEAGKFNQLSYFVLVLVLGAVRALDRARPLAAGALLGAAAVLKLLPGVFLLWLLLKRRWRAAGAMVAATVILAVAPPLVVFGPQRTVAYHREWWEYNVGCGWAAGIPESDLGAEPTTAPATVPAHFLDHRNQSIAQVLARLTQPDHPFAAPFQPLQLDPTACAWLARGLRVLLLAGLVWGTRRTWEALPINRRHAEAAVYAIGMLVFSPLLRQYYLVWSVPGLVLLARAAADGAAETLAAGAGGSACSSGPSACSRGSGRCRECAARTWSCSSQWASSCCARHATIRNAAAATFCGTRRRCCARQSRRNCSWRSARRRRGPSWACSPNRTGGREFRD